MHLTTTTWRRRLTSARAACALLLALNLLWLLALSCPFFPMDDPHYISNNPYVVGGLSWAGIKWAFTTNFLGYWIPLTWLSLALDGTLFGQHAWGYHLTNVLLHIANVLLLYRLLQMLKLGPWKSWLVAALFSIHPLRVESVVWASERKDVLAALFALLALIAYVRFVRDRGTGWFLGISFLFACSLMAKPMVMPLPVLMLLLDFWPLGRVGREPWKRLLLEKATWAAIAGIVAANTYLIEISNGTLQNPLSVRLQTMILSYFLYVRNMFYFGALSVHYWPRGSVPGWELAGAALFTLGITALLLTLFLRGLPEAKPMLMGWCWFLIAIFPMSGLVQVGFATTGDRFMYFPSIGLFIALVWAAEGIARRWNALSIRLVEIAALAFFTAFMVNRLLLWRDPLILLEHDLRLDPDNPYLQSLAGVAAAQAHDDALARMHFERAATLDPRDFPYAPPPEPATTTASRSR